MNRIGRNLTILLRTERMIARRQMSVAIGRATVYVLAGMVGLIALLMLDIAAYHALSARLGPAGAAALVGLGNAALAAALAALAARIRPGAELDPVRELRDMAEAELHADLENAATEARDIARSLRRIARDPLGATLPAVIGPVLSALLRAGRK